ncbi:RNA-binding protein [Gluconacetobacter entanii]|uniref:S4 domain-containing protein n=1 Tax=Gluconacetobacter entanii TaxID=108528 RepID=UPI001C9362E4|nr:S4 domain-containing protein [Gluconacetobacter entanii]MBY4639382.1 RNA-binding protein [Gluconacetobacter entanii]MCW4582156.1 S4 domain-containing protein [Gluconacetobacter entanii]MCW4585485.1 S4 domain-containing protein [Gluconacetobacter entanii]MCW4588554.1 S4 domain-containing protein [Gluconacetobacter entanii]
MSRKGAREAGPGEDAPQVQRLDLWLWHARFARSRNDCAEFIAAGQVRINRQRTIKAHAQVHLDDILTLPAPDRRSVMVIRVTGFARRREGASAARMLYDVIPEIDEKHRT